MFTLTPTFQTKKPTVYAPKQSVDLKSQLQTMWKDTSELDRKVEQEIQESKSMKKTFNDLQESFKKANEAFPERSQEENYIGILNAYKNKGYSIEGVNIDEELSAFWVQWQETQVKTEEAPVNNNQQKMELLKEKWKEFAINMLPSWDPISRAGISQIPKIWTNLLKFAYNIGGWIDRLLWNNMDEEDMQEINQAFDSIGDAWKQKLQDFFNVDPEATTTKIWEVLAEIATPMPSSKITAWKTVISWIKNIDKLKDAYNALDFAGKKFLEKIVSWTTKWSIQWAEYSVVSEWELQWEDIKSWAIIWGWLPVVWTITNLISKWANTSIKFGASKLWWLDDTVTKKIEENPQLVKDILSGKISPTDISNEIKKQFTTPEEYQIALEKIKEAYVNKYRLYSIVGKKAQSEIVDTDIPELISGKISERSSIWQKFQEFSNQNVVGKKNDIISLLDSTAWIKKEGKTIIWTDAQKASKTILETIESYFTKRWGQNLTQEKLREIEKALNSKANPTQAGASRTAEQNIIANFAKKVSDFADEKIPWLKEVSEQYRTATKELTEIQKLFTQWGNSTNVRESLYTSLKNILNNPTKLKNIKNAMGDNIEVKLRQIQDGIVAEKAMDEISKISNVKTFIQKMKNKELVAWNLPFSESLKKDLTNLLPWEQEQALINKIYNRDLWQETLKNVSQSVITNIEKKGKELISAWNKEKWEALVDIAEKLTIVKSLAGKISEEITDVATAKWDKISAAAGIAWATRAMKWDVTQLATFIFGTNKKTWANFYDKYYRASSKISWIKQKAQDPTNDNLRDFIQKVFIYMNLND